MERIGVKISRKAGTVRDTTIIGAFLLGFALTGGASAVTNPTFTGIVNAANDIPPGFSNSGIAQGSIFVVYGSNLGPAALLQATLPLPTAAGLGGTSISITAGSTAVPAPIIYTSGGQVAAIMPSTTPVGNGTLSLTFNGNTGATPVTVVASAFGISTINYSGSGPAVVTFGNNSVVSPTSPAKPGDTLVMYGTGLGPLPAGQSDNVGAVEGNLPTPIVVFVGNIEALILYQGRTPTLTGLDQINFMVPTNAPLGCSVPVSVVTIGSSAANNIPSNVPTISLASADGIPCTDPTQIIPTSALSKNGLKAAFVGLKQSVQLNFNGNPPTSSTTTNYKASAGFLQFSQAQETQQFSGINSEPTLGTCLTGTIAGTGGGGNGGPVATYLDGGTSVTLIPPSGPQIILPSVSTGAYQNTSLTTGFPSGTWSFSNGAGGTAVGPLNFSFPIPAQVTWTNEVSLSSGPPIDRTQGLLITWSGGDAKGFVDIQGQGQIGSAQNTTFSYYFDCSAPTSASQFMIVPSILLPMPTGANAFAGIQVSTVAFPGSVPAVAGFDAVVDSSQFQASAPVIFK
jgi:uncharacterized protein (TIGR03437 family)